MKDRESDYSKERIVRDFWYAHSKVPYFAAGWGLKPLKLHGDKSEALISTPLLLIGKAQKTENFLKVESDSTKIGEHMSIIKAQYRGPKRVLSDGTQILPGTLGYQVHFSNNMVSLGEQDNLIGFTRELFRSAQVSLKILSRMCVDYPEEFTDTNFFFGESHLAGPLAKRLGADVFDIDNPLRKYQISRRARSAARLVASKNKSWKMIDANSKGARIGFISKEKLLQKYYVE